MIQSQLIEAGKNVTIEQRLTNISIEYSATIGPAKVILTRAEETIEKSKNNAILVLNLVDAYLDAIGCEIEIKKK